MHRSLVAAAVVVAASAALAQTKIATVEDYARLMKSNAELGGAMNKALSAPSYPEARKVLAAVRRNFVALQGFWTERKRTDAVAIVKDGLGQIDTLDRMLAADADLAAIGTASQEFGRTTCAACHKLYREGDDQSGFRFKPGVFEK
jgi:mono/diheme cytochrome c family protein